jgi:hypothetical protein
MIAVLLLISTAPGHADHGGHGYRSHGYRGHWHRGFHRSGGVHLLVSPGLVVPFGSYWGPYSPPPVVVAPSPRVYVEPSPPPPHYWYYCDASQAYYPYVQLMERVADLAPVVAKEVENVTFDPGGIVHAQSPLFWTFEEPSHCHLYIYG